MDTNGPTESDRLDSWKAIAQYLKRDERTVRRWEREGGLPVRRVPGGRGTSVFAYTAEIDAWLKASESPPSAAPAAIGDAAASATTDRRRRHWRTIAAGAATVALLVIGVWQLRPTHGNADDLSVTVDENGIAATDAAGRSLWRYPFTGYRAAFSGFGTRRTQVIGGLNPRVFVLTSVRVGRSDDVIESGELTALTSAGRVVQTFRFDDKATFDGKEYGAPWAITTFAVDDRGGSRRIAVAAHHYQWSASTVTILDERFQRLATYWQWGWIEALHWLTPDRLLVGGFDDSDEHNGGMLALLDPARMNGQAPEAAGSPAFCSTCGPVVPLRMVVMPRTELNRATVSRFNRAVVEVTPERLTARTIEVEPENGAIVDALYDFSPRLELLRAAFGGPYWERHEALYAQGKINHDRAHCADRAGPQQILTWQPDSGWQRQNLNK